MAKKKKKAPEADDDALLDAAIALLDMSFVPRVGLSQTDLKAKIETTVGVCGPEKASNEEGTEPPKEIAEERASSDSFPDTCLPPSSTPCGRCAWPSPASE